jgi:hypothetical protein
MTGEKRDSGPQEGPPPAACGRNGETQSLFGHGL